MDALQQSAFLQALGWSLADSIWQMGIAWLIYFISVRYFVLSAIQKHNLAVLSLAAGSLAFVSSIIYRLAYPSSPGYIESFFIYSPLVNKPFIENIFPVISGIYLLLSFFMLLRFTWLYKKTRELNRITSFKAPIELRLFTQKSALKIGIKKQITVGITSGINTPVTIGFFKPIILLPVSVTNHLSTEQAETILLHELFHIKRNDYLINILVNFSSIFLYFNPFARLICNAIKTEREHCCDDAVMQFNYEPETYATALFKLEKLRQTNTPVMAMAATGKGNLLNRIKRILSGEEDSQVSMPGILWGMASLVLITFFALHAGNNFHSSRLVSIPNYSLEFFSLGTGQPRKAEPAKEDLVSVQEEVEILPEQGLTSQNKTSEKQIFTINLNKTSNKNSKSSATVSEIQILDLEPSNDSGIEEVQEVIVEGRPIIRFVEKESKREYSLAEKAIFEAPEIFTANTPAFLPKNVLNFNAIYFKDTIPMEQFMKEMEKTMVLAEAKIKEIYKSGYKLQEETEKQLLEVQKSLNNKLAQLNAQRVQLYSREALRQAEIQLQNLQKLKLDMQAELELLQQQNKKGRIVEL